VAAAAEQVFAQLTAEERLLLPLILDVKAVQERLGCGRSTAYNRINKLKELIRELTGATEYPEEVAGEVLTLCAPVIVSGLEAGRGHADLPAATLTEALDNLADVPSVPGAGTRPT
jgi:hypothetical protein